MIGKNKLVEIIYNELDYIYCDNCRFSLELENGCDDCHRKMMHWEISLNASNILADKILKELECKIL